MPIRIQRKRTRGWKMPENTVYVGRPGKWGNPFKPGMVIREQGTLEVVKELKTVKDCIDWYKKWLRYMGKIEDIRELKGKNLACWCKEGEPCHADVLLEIANS